MLIGFKIGDYTIIDYLGKGSFGTVYKCEKDEGIYAIKIFNLEYVFQEFKNNGEDNRITREINALKGVDHPNVIKIVNHGEFKSNNQSYIYIIMEYLEGVDLKDKVDKENLELNEIIQIFVQILDGLDAIHQSNIIHRDIKPHNIYVTNEGQVKILDFGLSKLIDFTSITSTGAEIGSPLYMSPEQIKDIKSIDYRSDYYALGIILFEMISKTHPYGNIQSKEQLYYKIINEQPRSILHYLSSIPNKVDNLIEKLLSKLNYQRPNNIEEIKAALDISNILIDISKELIVVEPKFFLRLWNEKTILYEMHNEGYTIENCVFPINHQQLQKNLLDFLTKEKINYFFDPATTRLAYDTFSDVKGLVSLPYSPDSYRKLEIDDFLTSDEKKLYVKKVIDEQLKYDPDYLVAPFHVSNNSNYASIKNEESETWFTLDVKLLKESKDYLNRLNLNNKKLVGGFCVRADILTTKSEKDYFVNVLSSLPCDLYWIYVDCIDYASNTAQLYNYIKTLIELQNSTGKPVVAGRVGSIGLILASFGLYGFESGAARFESFYEDLYKDTSTNYNMYVMYYIPELFKCIPVNRRDPSKIINILRNEAGIDIQCQCPFCKDKAPEEMLIEKNTRKHFIYRRQHEIELLRGMNVSERLNNIEARINQGLEYYKKLKPIFKESDYTFLKNWKRIIPDLRNEFGV